MDDMIDKMFLSARTHYHWLKKDVDPRLLEEIYNISKCGPTSLNCQPLRIIFIRSLEQKLLLKKCLSEGNVEKTMSAPVTAIFAYDIQFYESLPDLFPHADVRSWFLPNSEHTIETAKLNSSLQAAYFIIAARSSGLDCGPMSGFNNKTCDDLFFNNSNLRSYFMCNLGYGDSSKLYPRLPRYEFSDVCQII